MVVAFLWCFQSFRHQIMNTWSNGTYSCAHNLEIILLGFPQLCNEVQNGMIVRIWQIFVSHQHYQSQTSLSSSPFFKSLPKSFRLSLAHFECYCEKHTTVKWTCIMQSTCTVCVLQDSLAYPWIQCTSVWHRHLITYIAVLNCSLNIDISFWPEYLHMS